MFSNICKYFRYTPDYIKLSWTYFILSYWLFLILYLLGPGLAILTLTPGNLNFISIVYPVYAAIMILFVIITGTVVSLITILLFIGLIKYIRKHFNPFIPLNSLILQGFELLDHYCISWHDRKFK
jgi:hypothetical protein